MKTRCNEKDILLNAAQRVKYDPLTGVFTWLPKPPDSGRSRRWNGRYAGEVAGSRVNGYLVISFLIDGKKVRVYAHRLAWFLSHHEVPSQDIDHINQDKSDNRLVNLRSVRKSLNSRNVPLSRTNTSGVVGVCWSKKSSKWQAQCTLDRRNYHLGLFDDIHEAAKASADFRMKHGFTENHGRLRSTKEHL